jgi:hypothetical protein
VRRSGILSLLVVLALALALPAPAAAQEASSLLEHERAGRSRSGYAWGEPAPDDEPTREEARAPTRRFHHVFASLGVGGTLRTIVHIDVCNPNTPGFEGCFFSPPYLQLRGTFFFEDVGDIQHGVTLGIATNLNGDGLRTDGIDPLTQWVLSPAYVLRGILSEWFQVMGHVGIPLAFAGVSGSAARSDTAFNWGFEVQATAVLKFLAGLGVYVAGNASLWFAGTSSVWPTLSLEAGLVFEYEVLP